jgi:hypothetical protein
MPAGARRGLRRKIAAGVGAGDLRVQQSAIMVDPPMAAAGKKIFERTSPDSCRGLLSLSGGRDDAASARDLAGSGRGIGFTQMDPSVSRPEVGPGRRIRARTAIRGHVGRLLAPESSIRGRIERAESVRTRGPRRGSPDGPSIRSDGASTEFPRIRGASCNGPPRHRTCLQRRPGRPLGMAHTERGANSRRRRAVTPPSARTVSMRNDFHRIRDRAHPTSRRHRP